MIAEILVEDSGGVFGGPVGQDDVYEGALVYRVRVVPGGFLVGSLDNKLDEVRSRISYQQDIKNCNILCSTKSWLSDDMNNIQHGLYTLSVE